MVNANWPTMAFEVCFNQDPFDPSPPAAVWTSLTSRVVAWKHTTPSGRQHELARTEAATLSVLLDNQDGALDPSNAASSFWPNVVPYRQFRIKATWSATTYNLVFGYVERWPQHWDGGKGWVELTVVDTLALLEPKTFRSCYDEEILADSPVACYPLSEAGNATSFGSIATTQQPQATIANSKLGAGTVTAGNTSILPADPASCVQFAGGTVSTAGSVIQLGQAGAGPFILTNQSFSVECWFQIPSAPAYAMTLVQQVEGNTGGLIVVDWFLTIGSDGKVHAFIGNVGHTNVVDTASAGTFADGKPHHVLYTWAVSGGVTTTTLYVDGTQQATGFANVTFVMTSGGWVQVGGTLTNLSHQSFYNGFVGHVAIYPAALSSGQALAHYQAGNSAFAGELSGARFSRLLRYAAYQGPSAVDTGQSQMAAATIAGESAPQALADVVVAENGNDYVAGDGSVTFKQRSARWNTAAVATLGELETPYLGDVRFDFDPTFVYERVEVTRPGGVTVAAFSTSGQKRYGPRTLQETPQILLDLEATDRSNYQLTQYQDPKLRLPQITLDPASNPALWPIVLGTKIGDRLTVKRRPFGAPVITQDVFVEAISHDVDFRVDGPPHWRVTYLLSPAGATFAFWKLDDATFGKLDFGNLISY